MKRLFAIGLVVMVAGIAPQPAAAQRSAGPSLAERLAALRDGWSFAGDADAEAAPAAEASERGVRVAQRDPAPAPAAKPTGASYPSLDARQLLPRRWFGTQVATDAEPAPPQKVVSRTDTSRPAASPRPRAQGSTGSARARLLRQAREQAIATESGAVVARPAPRAGSVLSSDASAATPSVTTPPRMSGRLARSIAAEVAESLIEPDASRTADRETKPTTTTPDPAVTVEAPAATSDSIAVEGTTPTESSADESASEAKPAAVASRDEGGEVEAGTGLRVAANPTKKLPLFIGDRYSSLATTDRSDASVVPGEQGSTASEETADERAAEAFTTEPKAAEPLVATTTRSRARAEAADDLLLTQSMPVLVSKVSGPRRIVVGREASYRVLLANRGDVAADRVVSRVTVPDWAEVAAVETADGRVERGESLADDNHIVWRRDCLAPGEVIQLALRLVARSGRPIELGVTHTHTPIDASTLVEVQEPKLSLALVGPRDVLYGKPQLFRLTLSNPGTGVAEAVMLHLTPPGGEADRRTSHRFGSLAPGEERSVEIELTAREAGELVVAASAVAEGDVTAAIEKEVFCRQPQLVVDWRGPSERYSGSPATYYFRVRNPGTATAPGVDLTVDLPEGFEPAPSDETPDAVAGRLTYRVGALPPGDDRYFELRGTMRQAGANRLALRAEATDQTRSEPVTAVTEVIALADLKLDVLDPKGPIATGQEIAYEVRVTNRGSNDARDVRVLGLFSDGIEPHYVEGGVSTIHDGRVAFDKIDRLGPGEERLLTIHARAHEAGTHLFRAEVLCRDLEIKLAAEETTRFFEDEAIDVAADAMRHGNRSADRYSR